VNHEADIIAAVDAEFGDAVEYRRPDWREGEQRHLHPEASHRGASLSRPARSKLRLKDSLAAFDAEARAGRSLAVLAPARTDTRWCWDYCRPWEVRFLRGRVHFPGHRGGAPFPSMLVVMGPAAEQESVRHREPFSQTSLLSGGVAVSS
jgi:hypothetical protein